MLYFNQITLGRKYRPDFRTRGLKKKSLVKISKIATIDKSLAIGKLGAIDVERIKELDRKLIAIFEIKADKYYT